MKDSESYEKRLANWGRSDESGRLIARILVSILKRLEDIEERIPAD